MSHDAWVPQRLLLKLPSPSTQYKSPLPTYSLNIFTVQKTIDDRRLTSSFLSSRSIPTTLLRVTSYPPFITMVPPTTEGGIHEIAELTTARSLEQLERIGAGFCGSVWAQLYAEDSSTTQLAMKREDGGPGRSLLHEYQMHERIIQAAQLYPHATSFEIPSCYRFIPKDDQGWDQILPRLPPTFTSCNALISEKISPMPHSVRQLLAERYVSVACQGTILADQKNTHCLIRPYLGRRRHISKSTVQPSSRPTFFSLRNFPLHVDQMEDFGLNPLEYALAMADALAFVHWQARVDANDVEFVLAPPRQDHRSRPAPFESAALGSHVMWILDFDCCREMAMNEDGVDKAAKAFWRNDPYYPRPGNEENSADQQL